MDFLFELVRNEIVEEIKLHSMQIARIIIVQEREKNYHIGGDTHFSRRNGIIKNRLTYLIMYQFLYTHN